MIINRCRMASVYSNVPPGSNPHIDSSAPPFTPPPHTSQPPVVIEPERRAEWQETQEFISKWGVEKTTQVKTYTQEQFNEAIPPSERKKPTLALALALFKKEGVNVDLSTKFSIHEGNPQIYHVKAIPPTSLEVTEIYGKKCFCGKMTFEVTVHVDKEKDPLGEGGLRTIRFEQMIETTIEVPKAPVSGGKMSQEQVDHHAKVQAMGLLHAYGSTLSNPELLGNNAKIQQLSRKTFLNADMIRESTSKGFYERHITWHNEPPKGILARINHLLETHGSASMIKMEGYGHVSLKPIWQQKIPCKHLDETRDRVVNTILERAKAAPALNSNSPPPNNLEILPDEDPAMDRVSTGYTDDTIRQSMTQLQRDHGLSQNDVLTMMRQDLAVAQNGLNTQLHGDSLDVHAISVYMPTQSIEHYLAKMEGEFNKIAKLQEKRSQIEAQIQAQAPMAGTDLETTKLTRKRDDLDRQISHAVTTFKECKTNAEKVFNDLEKQHARTQQEPTAIRSLCAQSNIHLHPYQTQIKALDDLAQAAQTQNISGRMATFREAFAMRTGELNQACGMLGIAPFVPPRPMPQSQPPSGATPPTPP